MKARIAELEEERFRLKFRSATETLDDPLRLRVIRRDIARLKTVVNEQQTKAGAATRGWEIVMATGERGCGGEERPAGSQHAQDAHGNRRERQDAEDGGRRD